MNQILVEMLKSLNEKDLKEMKSANKELHSIIEKYNTVELANSLFIKFRPVESFKQMIKTYKSEIDIL